MHYEKYKAERGFTLIEVIVVAAIIAILAGILVPMIFSQIDESKISKARADVKTFSTAITVFHKDTGVWPNCNGSTLLISSGALDIASIQALGYTLDDIDTLIDHLETDDNECYGTKWKGPYINEAGEDSWGNAYFVNAANFSVDDAPVLVLSSGPDGVFQTGPNATVASGDDIAIRIK